MKRGLAHGKLGKAVSVTRNAACLAGILLAMVTAAPSVLLAPTPLAVVKEGVVGTSAGDFTLRDIEGKQVRLSDFRGKTVLLSFWATWCLPCRVELPTIQKIYEQHKDKDVVVLAVDDESEATISKFLHDNHYSFTALMDHERTLFRKFVVHYIPTVLVINDDGIIVREIVGWHGPQALLTAVKTGTAI
jgi:peroxiredoxin